MKISVELSDSELDEICSLTGEHKKGPAIRKMVTEALQMKRREQIANKFITGEWGVELADFESSQNLDDDTDQQTAEAVTHP